LWERLSSRDSDRGDNVSPMPAAGTGLFSTISNTPVPAY
jgi:hypothetical protein